MLGRQKWLPGSAMLADMGPGGAEAGSASIWTANRAWTEGLVLGLAARPGTSSAPLGPTCAPPPEWLPCSWTALAVLFAVWVTRLELDTPLTRLTGGGRADGRRRPYPAQGPVPGRGDNLSRLSRALHSMTLTDRRMMDEAPSTSSSSP
jgi:hypothetical protein